ncbi:MAG: NADH-quinone oxidoreductase subunit J [Deltaproteobacteria bacterium]|nr:NADH-quinone oxidoreductase subunit J [Deltaproteobacteria bacterium]
MTEQVIFYVSAFVALISAAGVVLNVRNTLYAALCLVITMLSLAVLFILLNAEFIGVLQVMVYAGAIVVLFLFVIMLLNIRGGDMGADRQPVLKIIGTLLIVGASVKLVPLLSESRRAWPEVGPEFGTVRAIGGTLYTDYLLAFEIAGVLLLAGIVGAVVMGKQRID